MNKKNIVLTFLIVLFIFDMIFVLTNGANFIDNLVYNFVRSINNSFFDNYFKFITVFADIKVVLLIIVILNVKLSRKDAIQCDLIVGGCSLVNFIIKNIVRRERPSVLRLVEQGGYSFPSGHSIAAIALYGYLIYLVNKTSKYKKIKIILDILLVFLIINIFISRIYLGVHFATDVIGSILLGFFGLIFIISLDNKFNGGD